MRWLNWKYVIWKSKRAAIADECWRYNMLLPRPRVCALLWLLLLLPLSGCLNKIPAVARYQASATEKCERTHTPEECKPLPYPSEEPR